MDTTLFAPPTGLAGPPAHAPQALAPHALQRATLAETLAVTTRVLLPTIAQGVILRRPRLQALAERFQLDRQAIRCLQRLRRAHGGSPLLLPLPDRPRLLLLEAADVHRVLQGTPEPYATDSSEKRAALGHLQPRGVLVSPPALRPPRRAANVQALQPGQTLHALAPHFADVVADESRWLLAQALREGRLGWDAFAPAWQRIVRRVVFGDAARDDRAVTALVDRLRARANWAFLLPRRDDLLQALLGRIRRSLAHPDPRSLVGALAAAPLPPQAAPEQQVPQWLFAFDPAGMAAWRALALLATHPALLEQARAEARTADDAARPFARAMVQESLRLWPTTPLILRRTTTATDWGGRTLPAGSGLIVYTPYFHRDGERLSFADRCTPALWTGGTLPAQAALVPFSEGAADCPGRQVVLLLASLLLGQLLLGARWRLEQPAWLDARRPLPATLNHFGLRFGLHTR